MSTTPKSPRTGKALKGKRDIAARYRRFVDAASTPDENGRFLSYTQAYIEAFDPDPERTLNDIGHDRCAWLKKHPEIEDRVEKQRAEVRETLRREALALPIARQEQRIAAKQARKDALDKIIAARKADATMAQVPGGSTGYVTRKLKSIGSGLGAKIVPEYEVDVATSREMSNLENEVAKELGQITDKSEMTVKPDLSALTDEELDAYIAITGKLAGRRAR
jgi:hypothetical protein